MSDTTLITEWYKNNFNSFLICHPYQAIFKTKIVTIKQKESLGNFCSQNGNSESLRKKKKYNHTANQK